MIKLLINAGEIYCPERTDCKNVLIAGGSTSATLTAATVMYSLRLCEALGTRIAALLTDDEAQDYAKLLPPTDVHDAAGCLFVPGALGLFNTTHLASISPCSICLY